MYIAIIGMGEVGRCYASALAAAGVALRLCDARPSPAALELAAALALDVDTAPGAWLGEATWVLSCVTGAQAPHVAGQVIPFLRQGAAIADFTTATPDTKRAAAGAADRHGVRYVDTAIMGAISLGGVRTPLLLAGAGAEELQALLEGAGARVRVLPNAKAGDAIALKILRSVFTKGMEALAVELLMSAEQQGVRSQLYEQLGDIDETPLHDFLDMLVRTHVIHAARRAHEVRDAQTVLASQNLRSLVLPGVERRFDVTAQALVHEPIASADPTVGQALDWLLVQANRS